MEGVESMDACEVFVDVFLGDANEGAFGERFSEAADATVLESVEFSGESLHPFGGFKTGTDS
jgi:hypothetical protein